MSWLELGLVLLTLDWALSLESLFGILLVLGELGKGLVVTLLAWVRWSEWLIVFHTRSSLCALGLGWHRRVLREHIFGGVENVSLAHLLREWFILEHGSVVFSLSSSEVLGSVIIILHVRNFAAEVDLLAGLTLPDWVGTHVWWSNDDITGVLFVSVVLLNLNVVSHMLERSSVDSFLRICHGSERLLISIVHLFLTILFAGQTTCDRNLIWLTDRKVIRLGEENLVDGRTLLDRLGCDIGWVNNDISWVITILVDASYSKNDSY